MNTTSIQQTVDEIIAMYHQYGHEQYGEKVTQLQHMVQTASLAEEEGHDAEVILAAFLHDIGHFMGKGADDRMGDYGIVSHEKLGAAYLRTKGFGEKIAALVEGHVAAKRYLTFTKPSYYDRLSEASKQTLIHQGGPMTAEEARAFEASPYFEMSIKMREWDEDGKVPESTAHALDKFRTIMVRFLESRAK